MRSNSRIGRRDFLRKAGGAALGAAAGGMGPFGSSARAQEKFPAREVNWIIYQAPGGSIDTTARIIQPYLEKHGVKTSLEYVLGGGRPRRAQQALHRAAGRLSDDDGVRARRRHRRGHRAGRLQGERVHSDLRLERGELAAVREEGFADPDLPAIRRRVQKAPGRGRHHRALGLEPHPARGAAEGAQPAVRAGAFRGLRQGLSGGDGRPCRCRDQRAGLGLAHARQPAFSRRHRRRAREGAARRADLDGARLQGHAHRSDSGTP